jgi:polar amino acid transport system substrate-binding protein
MRPLRSLLTVLVAIVATLSVAAAQNRTLQFVSPVRPPFTDAPGKPRFALDLVEAALQRIHVTANTALVAPGDFGRALMTGPYDGTAEAWRDSAREQALLFSEPYLENRLVLAGRRGADVSAKTLADLKGKRIAIISGYAYGDDNLNAGPVFVGSNGEPESVRMLLAGEVEYVLMDDLVVQYIVNDYPDEARTRLSIGTTPLLIRPVHLALHRSLPDAAAIIKGFNSQLREMILDRTYHKLLHVDWIYTDVDGDGRKEMIGASDQAGKTAPQRAYSLFSQAQIETQVKKAEDERYFFGGAIYNGWSSVPDKYKTDYLDRPDHVHPTARVFTFSWK